MIVYIQSVKGGTGKSVIARFAADHFIINGENPIVMETDTGNPDVARSYMDADPTGKKGEILAVDTRKSAGFELLLDTILSAGNDRPVVINSGARNQEENEKFGPALDGLCRDAGLDLVTLWPMDTDTICVEQLVRYLRTVNHRTAIIKNLGLVTDADKSRFAFLAETKPGKKLPSVFFPALYDSVMDAMKSPRCKAVHELDETLTMGARYLARPQLAIAKKPLPRRWKRRRSMKHSPDKLRERFVEFLRIRDIRLSDAELERRIADFLAMANVLGLRDNDEVFGFLIANEAYRLINLDAIVKFRHAMETAGAKLAKSLRADIASSAETAAKKLASRWAIAAVLIMALAFGGMAWFTNRNCQAALAKLERVVSAEAETRQTAAFMDSEMGKKCWS